MKSGDKIRVDGFADELGINGYGGVYISTNGVIAVTPRKYAKKVLVTLDSIDGEGGATVLVFKRYIKPLEELKNESK